MSGPYTVLWRRELIEDRLATFTARAMQQGHGVAAITDAMDRIDELLASSPHEQGESRPAFQRIMAVAPLSVTYEIFDEANVVVVLKVNYWPRRGR
jgi:hypothetical protein